MQRLIPRLRVNILAPQIIHGTVVPVMPTHKLILVSVNPVTRLGGEPEAFLKLGVVQHGHQRMKRPVTQQQITVHSLAILDVIVVLLGVRGHQLVSLASLRRVL